jgi:hypothetical protein
MNFQKFCAEILPHITCEGKPIEDFEDDYDNLEYFDTDFSCWMKAEDAIYNLDVLRLELRIKPSPEYSPFTKEDEEMFFGKKVYTNTSMQPCLIVDCCDNGVWIAEGGNNHFVSYQSLLELFIFPDKTKCGVEL